MWYIWPPEPKDEEHALGPPREGWSFGGGQEEQMFSNSMFDLPYRQVIKVTSSNNSYQGQGTSLDSSK